MPGMKFPNDWFCQASVTTTPSRKNHSHKNISLTFWCGQNYGVGFDVFIVFSFVERMCYLLIDDNLCRTSYFNHFHVPFITFTQLQYTGLYFALLIPNYLRRWNGA